MRKGDVGTASTGGVERTCRSRCGKARPLVDFHRVAKGSERRSYRCRFCCAWDQRQTRLRKKAAKAAPTFDQLAKRQQEQGESTHTMARRSA